MSTTDLRRRASVVIYRGEDIEQIAFLRRKVQVAEQRDLGEALRAGDTLEAPGAREEYDAFVNEAADRAYVVELASMKRTPFRELKADHPAREKNDDDAPFGVNVDTFGPPFLEESVAKVSEGDRELSRGQVRDFLEELAEGEYDRIFSTAYWLNVAPGADPKDDGPLSTTPRSDAT